MFDAKAFFLRLLRVQRRRILREIDRRGTIPRPSSPRARVIVFAMEKGHVFAWQKSHINGPGKVRAIRYFPPFRDVLHGAGFDLAFALSPRGLRRAYASDRPNIVICLYREGQGNYESRRIGKALAPADLVFNDPASGAIVGNKRASYAAFSAAGIPLPEIPAPESDFPVLSNAVTGSHTATQLLDRGADLDPDRYNTRFIDTRVTHEGQEYYTTVRLSCVGRHMVNAYPRARPVTDNDPNTRGTTTPRDVGLMRHLFDIQVAARRSDLEAMAAKLGGALGPCFLGCDLLIERGSGRMYLCEPNFKFNDPIYIERFIDLAEQIGADPTVFDWQSQARASAEAFLACCEDHGIGLEGRPGRR